MFTIIGILVVFGAIVGGYLMEHGNLKVLLQPAELVIIGGASIGTVLIANPLHILMKILSGVLGSFGGSKFTKKWYLDQTSIAEEAQGVLDQLVQLANTSFHGSYIFAGTDTRRPHAKRHWPPRRASCRPACWTTCRIGKGISFRPKCGFPLDFHSAGGHNASTSCRWARCIVRHFTEPFSA